MRRQITRQGVVGVAGRLEGGTEGGDRRVERWAGAKLVSYVGEMGEVREECFLTKPPSHLSPTYHSRLSLLLSPSHYSNRRSHLQNHSPCTCHPNHSSLSRPPHPPCPLPPPSSYTLLPPSIRSRSLRSPSYSSAPHSSPHTSPPPFPAPHPPPSSYPLTCRIRSHRRPPASPRV